MPPIAPSTARRPAHQPAHRPRRGFTLIELMVVMAIIVLLLGLALPAFNLIRGSRSVEGAQNQLSALLARARNRAIGLQKPVGVMFFLDKATNRATAAMVREVSVGQINNTGNVVLLDLDQDNPADFLSLPAGVTVQVVDDPKFGADNTDRYVGFNTQYLAGANVGALSPTPAPLESLWGGCILFDGSGQIVSRLFAYQTRDNALVESPLGQLFFGQGNTPGTMIALVPAARGMVPVMKSSIGLVLLDGPTYESKYSGNKYNDAEIPNGGAVVLGDLEDLKEQWIDDNGLILLVNRYNGTLVKGE